MLKVVFSMIIYVDSVDNFYYNEIKTLKYSCDFWEKPPLRLKFDTEFYFPYLANHGCRLK